MMLVTAFCGAQPMTDYQPAPPPAVVLHTQNLRLEIGADGLVRSLSGTALPTEVGTTNVSGEYAWTTAPMPIASVYRGGEMAVGSQEKYAEHEAPVYRGGECFPATAADSESETAARIEQIRNRGLFVHDPSAVVRWKGEYWFFSTGRGVLSRHSKDLASWEEGPRVFSLSPAWTTGVVNNFRGYFWAPDVIRLNDQFLLYYSVSAWGKNTSAIGLATNPTLDPEDPNYHWTDRGVVIQSGAKDNFNAIDPSVLQDADGRLWMAFGSFWSGIKLVELDRTTGKRIAPDSPIHSLAWHDTIEAACLYRRGDFYYLFVNWGLCARGVNSTYNIRVGRSARITGPYLDRRGEDLRQGGGTLFLGTRGSLIGPGHAGILSENGRDWLSCHYYDGKNNGRATLAILPLTWTTDGWPEVVADVGK
jgi:arabinan endo-1,5-alpha-L-arabinosidase